MGSIWPGKHRSCLQRLEETDTGTFSMVYYQCSKLCRWICVMEICLCKAPGASDYFSVLTFGWLGWFYAYAVPPHNPYALIKPMHSLWFVVYIPELFVDTLVWDNLPLTPVLPDRPPPLNVCRNSYILASVTIWSYYGKYSIEGLTKTEQEGVSIRTSSCEYSNVFVCLRGNALQSNHIHENVN